MCSTFETDSLWHFQSEAYNPNFYRNFADVEDYFHYSYYKASLSSNWHSLDYTCISSDQIIWVRNIVFAMKQKNARIKCLINKIKLANHFFIGSTVIQFYLMLEFKLNVQYSVEKIELNWIKFAYYFQLFKRMWNLLQNSCRSLIFFIMWGIRICYQVL